LQFVPAYNKGNWFFMTGSYRGALGMAKSSDAFLFLDYWNMYKTILTDMFTKDSIRGFYMIEELGINSIHEVSVLPHIHAIIDADTINQAEIQELAEQEAEKCPTPMLKPDVMLTPIESQRTLMDRIRYLFKPVNFTKAYENDWLEKCTQSEQEARILNSHATDLILGYSHINRGRDKMTAKGTLNSRCKEYIGIPKKKLNNHKRLLQQLQREAGEDYIERKDDEP
jgi:hypothetical protein